MPMTLLLAVDTHRPELIGTQYLLRMEVSESVRQASLEAASQEHRKIAR